MRIEKSNYADIITNTHTSVYEYRTVIHPSWPMNRWQQMHGHKRKDTGGCSMVLSSPTSTAVFIFKIIMVSRLVQVTVKELVLGSLAVLSLVSDTY